MVENSTWEMPEKSSQTSSITNIVDPTVQIQKAVSAYFQSKQILLLGYARQ